MTIVRPVSVYQYHPACMSVYHYRPACICLSTTVALPNLCVCALPGDRRRARRGGAAAPAAAVGRVPRRLQPAAAGRPAAAPGGRPAAERAGRGRHRPRPALQLAARLPGPDQGTRTSWRGSESAGRRPRHEEWDGKTMCRRNKERKASVAKLLMFQSPASPGKCHLCAAQVLNHFYFQYLCLSIFQNR